MMSSGFDDEDDFFGRGMGGGGMGGGFSQGGFSSF